MSNGFKYIRILLIAGVIAIGSANGRVEAGVWDYLKQYYQALQQGELDEESIPETPMEYAGEIGLELQDKIELVFDEETPGIGEVQWMGITPEGTLLLTDDIARSGARIQPPGQQLYPARLGAAGEALGSTCLLTIWL